MTHDHIIARIEQKMPGAVVSHEEAYDQILNLHSTREQIVELLRLLRDDDELQFNFLTSLCGIHYPDDQGRELGLIYHLHNWQKNVRIRVKIFFPESDPYVSSVSSLWPTANWMERQEYDFFGIHFNGHPNLARILNVDDMTVFPMRKEYRLEDGTRTDKDDRFFGRDGHYGRRFD